MQLPEGISPVDAAFGAAGILAGVSLLTILLALQLAHRKTPGGRIMKLVTEQASILVPATFCLFASSGSQMLIPYFGGEFINIVTDPNGVASEELNKLMVAILATSVFMSVTTCIRGALYNLAGERIICRLRKTLFASLLRQEIAFFDEQSSGALISRLTSDTATLQSAASSFVSMGVRNMANLLMSLAILLFLSWKLTLTMLAVVPAVSVLAALTMRLSRKVSTEYQRQTAEAGKVAGEALGNMRTVRVFSRGESLVRRTYDAAVEETYLWGKRSAWIYGAWSGVVGLLFFIAFTVVLWVGASLVKSGDMRPNELISFILYTLSLSVAIMMLGSMLPQLGSTLGATVKIFELIEREPLMADGVNNPGGTCRGLVEFDEVSFAYSTRADAKVLNKVSFTAHPNQVVALVGSSGSGKSSCISLLLRLYDVLEGSVKLDCWDVRKLKREYLCRHVTVVSQEPVLFANSVRENILFGMEQASMDDVIKAAKLANCHEFIVKFPDSYDTLVGERGIQLSGGQKQRVAIARALLADPTVLALDEATSALDAESERLVQEALNSLMEHRRGRTSVVVAHRLSTIRGADLIVVLRQGVVQERGTHEQLLDMGGAYKDLVRRQLDGPNLEGKTSM